MPEGRALVIGDDGGSDPTDRRDEAAFTWGTQWWRCRYEIRSVSTEPEPVQCIVAVADSPVNWYEVLTGWEAPAKQPGRSEGSDLKYAPHAALARLNAWQEEEALGFVNRWGLLGLWNVERYKHVAPFLAPHRAGPSDWSGEEEYSGWYMWDELREKGGTYLHSFCEPLELFAAAAEEYQRLCRHLTASKESREEATQAEWGLTGWLHQCAHPRPVYDYKTGTWRFGWECNSLLGRECNSLLGWIYCLTFLEQVQGLGFRRCARPNCGKLFIPTRPNSTYCSFTCKNAQTVENHRSRRRQEDVGVVGHSPTTSGSEPNERR